VGLGWDGSTDNLDVASYRVYRDGVLLATVQAPSPAYTDDTAQSSTTYTYRVSALDAAGNESAQSQPATVTTPQPAVPLFADGFESGSLSAWDTSNGLTVQDAIVHSGNQAARGNTTNGATYAKKSFSSTQPDAYARVFFTIASQSSQVNILRLRDANGTSLAYLYVNTQGRLGVHDDATGANTTSNLTVTSGWHSVQLHLGVDTSPGTATGALQVWYDDTLVGSLSSTSVDVGNAPVGGMQIGETQQQRTYDITFDDAAFATDLLGAQ
jgi:chitodextrinase